MAQISLHTAPRAQDAQRQHRLHTCLSHLKAFSHIYDFVYTKQTVLKHQDVCVNLFFNFCCVTKALDMGEPCDRFTNCLK